MDSPRIPFMRCAHWRRARQTSALQPRWATWSWALALRRAIWPATQFSCCVLQESFHSMITGATRDTHARKIPVMNGSLQQRFGDNIYHCSNGKWIQADSRHSQIGAKPNLRNLKRDTATTDKVLVASEFTYWGDDGPEIPNRLSAFVHTAPGYRARFSEKDIARFLAWVGKAADKGMVGDPGEWRFEKYWR
jgi:hypothetical protein